MKKLIHFSKAIVLLITAILIIQIFFTAHLLKANVYLRHENSKIKIIEKKVLTYKECEIPECICPKSSYDCPAL